MRSRGQQGYTLVELIIAAGIFIVISVAAVGVLVSVLQSSSKTAAQRSVQQDARVNIEEIARTVRSSSIDYDFYEKAATDGEPTCALPSNASGAKVLPLFWNESVAGGEPNHKRVIFFYDEGNPDDATDGAIYRYESAEETPTPTCDAVFSSGEKVRLSSENVITTNTRFFVSPLASPYENPCADKASLCQVRRNTHPRVTMVIAVESLNGPVGIDEQADFSQTTLQTTVSTRAYPITGLVEE